MATSTFETIFLSMVNIKGGVAKVLHRFLSHGDLRS